MKALFVTFPALYFSALLMSMGISTFNTYMALALGAENVSSSIIGLLIALYYGGMVLGAKLGNLLIQHVGHIRCFAGSAAITTIALIVHLLTSQLDIWMVLRFVIGLSMMCQYMVVESWLNEESEANQRGIIFALYMVAVSVGQILGQLLLILVPEIGPRPMLLVTLFFVASQLPIVLTRRSNPPQLLAVPMELSYFFKRIPQSLAMCLGAGMMAGVFYGLAPVFGHQLNLSTSQISIFIAMAIAAGFVAQWPIGWLSDRMDRSKLIKINLCLMALCAIPLWGLFTLNYTIILITSFCIGVFLFTFYPLAVAYANDAIEPHKRVTLSGLLLAIFGVGAAIGPIITGLFMRYSPYAVFIMYSVVCLSLLIWMRWQNRYEDRMVGDGPVPFMPMAEHPVGMQMVTPLVEDHEIPDEVIVEVVPAAPVESS
ncbi:MFS transporter [Brackiella oedipodis]|uniref:MFS transporter n=1 Tax=Brackiella oedipodis TaxID=124225 RepID=UPI000491BE53|nr:MFS transporter [Brackiella oedipodis]